MCTWYDKMWKFIGIFLFIGALLYGGYKFYFSKHYRLITIPEAQQLGI